MLSWLRHVECWLESLNDYSQLVILTFGWFIWWPLIFWVLHRLQGRAWIRMCLMEKRLADYISVAVQSSKLAECVIVIVLINCVNEQINYYFFISFGWIVQQHCAMLHDVVLLSGLALNNSCAHSVSIDYFMIIVFFLVVFLATEWSIASKHLVADCVSPHWLQVGQMGTGACGVRWWCRSNKAGMDGDGIHVSWGQLGMDKSLMVTDVDEVICSCQLDIPQFPWVSSKDGISSQHIGITSSQKTVLRFLPLLHMLT